MQSELRKIDPKEYADRRLSKTGTKKKPASMTAATRKQRTLTIN
jgi:hypothetical protein